MNKRLELRKFGDDLVLAEKPIPTAPENGAVVKVHFSGICHSDLEVCRGYYDLGDGEKETNSQHTKLPHVPGQEVAGEIHSFGSKVDQESIKLKVEDKVFVFMSPGCGKCTHCNKGQVTLCEEVIQYIPGLCLEGGYQQYMTVPRLNYLVPIPEAEPLTMDIAAVLPCSAVTAYATISRLKPVLAKFVTATGGASLFLVGAGGVGLWAIQFARAMLPKDTKIIVADIAESKLAAAKEAGADKTVLWSREDTNQTNASKAKSEMPTGAHAAVDFVGSESTLNATFNAMAKCSTMVCVGLFGGKLKLPALPLVAKLITIVGLSSIGPPARLTEIANMVATEKVKPPPINTVPLDKAPQALKDLKEGKLVGKTVISCL